MRGLLAAMALVLTLVAASATPAAQDATSPAPLDRAAIEARLAEIAASERLDQTTRQAATEALRSALAQQERQAAAAARGASFRAAADEAPALLDSIRRELASPAGEPSIPDTSAMPVAELDRLLSEANAQVTSARESLASLRAEGERRVARRNEIARALTDLRQRLEALQTRPPAPGPESEDVVASARAAALAAEEAAVRAEIDALEAETASYAARRDLLPARVDQAARRVEAAERTAAAWLDVVTRRRQAEAAAATQEAARQRRELAGQNPALREYATVTQQLAAGRTATDGAAQRIAQMDARSAALRKDLAGLRERYRDLRQRLELFGVNRATSLLLLQEQDSLPSERALRAEIAEMQRRMEEAQYRGLEARSMRREAGDIQSVADSLMESVRAQTPEKATPVAEAAARELAVARRDLLDQIVADEVALFESASDVELAARELLEATRAFDAFLDEWTLWVKTGSAAGAPAMEDLRRSARIVLDGAEWRAVLSSLRADALAHIGVTSLCIVGLAALVALRWFGRRRTRALGGLVESFRTDRFSHTLRALLWAVVAAAPLPAAVWVIGWALSWRSDLPALGTSLGLGLRHAAGLIAPLAIAIECMRRGGLFEVHFRWPRKVVDGLRRPTRWLLWARLALGTIVAATLHLREDSVTSVVGRGAFVLWCLVLSAFFTTVLWPTGPVIAEFRRRQAGALLERLRPVWSLMLAGGPLALAILSALGYQYSAQRIEHRREQTIVAILLTILLHNLLMRWLFIARRRVAVDEARRRREQDADEESRDDPDRVTESGSPAIDEGKLDLPAISAQTKQLFRAGIVVGLFVALMTIWADVLPALRLLDRVEVWPAVRAVEDDGLGVLPELDATTEPAPAPGPNGAGAPAQADASGGGAAPALPGMSLVTGEEEQPAPAEESRRLMPSVSLADIGTALVILLATYFAFRNLPGLIEILVLQRLPLDQGSRFALSTVIRYTIAIVGLTAGAAALGLTWQKVQWLAAALTFGLAFGLQEIFANFISGLIILAERPIRIGDTVTVDTVTGTVTRIRMRATTITDWDRKELIIPNKNFITGDVINWTLSDTLLRVIIPVGVSYESDVPSVESTLLRVAAECRHVLKEPKPYVNFKAFGESTLDFELRVFIPHVEQLLLARHELHKAIIAAFRAEGIEIAFPQRDLHIRSADALAEAVRPGEAAARDGAG